MSVYEGNSNMNLRNIDWTHVEGNGNYSVFYPLKLQIDLESEMLKKTYNGDYENIKLYISTLFGLAVDFNDTYVTSNQFGNKQLGVKFDNNHVTCYMSVILQFFMMMFPEVIDNMDIITRTKNSKDSLKVIHDLDYTRCSAIHDLLKLFIEKSESFDGSYEVDEVIVKSGFSTGHKVQKNEMDALEILEIILTSFEDMSTKYGFGNGWIDKYFLIYLSGILHHRNVVIVHILRC